jgi:ABC-2 type transport system ATP-binding protein
MINANGLTMAYKNGKGIFDLSFSIREGEAFGYLGPNGAGKTTTIRNLLGFMKADKGTCSVGGLDSWEQAAEIQKNLGYIPGEIAFPGGMRGGEFLRLLSDMRGTKGLSRRKELEERFEINPNQPIRKMSKGMKQKIGIIAAFMHDPAVYILDEPTSGLDPLMQKRFVELILEERKRGKTFLMSSHMFEEVERTCDRVGIIRDGHLVATEDVGALKKSRQRKYIVTVESAAEMEALKKTELDVTELGHNRAEVTVGGSADRLLKLLATVTVESLDVAALSLEEIFMQYYGKEAK